MTFLHHCGCTTVQTRDQQSTDIQVLYYANSSHTERNFVTVKEMVRSKIQEGAANVLSFAWHAMLTQHWADDVTTSDYILSQSWANALRMPTGVQYSSC